MEVYLLIGILCVHMFYVSTIEYDPIIRQITLERSCNRDNLFGNFSLRDVPQFGAMCNIDVPKSEQAEFLLENNVVPILCMGLYDVSLRSCRAAINNTSPFIEIFPPTVHKFNDLFNTLEGAKNFSSLNIFCEETVKLYILPNSASNVTEDWWNLLNNELKDFKRCSSICRTNKVGRVHPLCSYIIWSNAIFNKHLKSQAESAEVDPNNVMAKDLHSNIVKPDKEYAKSDSTVTGNTSSNPSPEGDVPEELSNLEDRYINDNDSVKVTTKENLTNVIRPSHVTEHLSVTNKNHVNLQESSVISSIDAPIVEKEPESGIHQSNMTGIANKNTTKVQEFNNASDVNLNNGDFNFEPTEEQQINIEKGGQSIPEDGGDGDDADIPEETHKGNDKKNEFDRGGAFQSDLLSKDIETDKAYGNEEVLMEDHFIETEDPHFVTYFLCLTVLVILFYLAFYNKKKLVALAVEGRRTRNSRRRPNCSNYSKLNCNLEEALVSNTTASVTHVLY